MSSPKKILIIEDSRFTSELIKGALEKAGFGVEVRPNGPEGLVAAKKNPPDLIMLDVVMPGLDGFEVCRLLKGDPLTEAVPVMMLTVKDTLDDLHRGFKVAADYYMTKPFTEASLVENVKKIFLEREIRPGPQAAGGGKGI